jgi:SulP family sulfate permease
MATPDVTLSRAGEPAGEQGAAGPLPAHAPKAVEAHDDTVRGQLPRLKGAFRTQQLFPNLTAGVLMGITEVVGALSFGSLIFSGVLAPNLPYGIGMALASAAVLMIATSLTSRVPGVIASSQDSPAVILAVIASALAGSLSAATPEDRLATVLVAIAVTTLLTGLFYLALGSFRLGGLVRYVPYPVVGGFLAGTGWLLVQGAFGVVAGHSLTLAHLPALLRPDRLILWVPALLFALALFSGLRRFKHPFTMPAILLGAIAIFYLVLWATGTPLEAASSKGLLLGKVSGQAAWQPLTLHNLLAANWAVILRQGGNIASILVLSVVSLLLNASALELAIRRDVDLNRELRAAGIANILSGLAGGIVGYHALSLSTLSYRLGARGKLPGVLAGAICAAMLFAGSTLLAHFPTLILGGLLMYLGLDFLYEWVVVARSRLSRGDYAVVLLILLVIGATNFLVGVGVGLLVMILLFVLSYSRTDIVRHALSGSDISSKVQRCSPYRQALRELGQQVYIVRLQGFLFFGNAHALLEQIRARVIDSRQPPVRYVVVDFGRVTGLDSSAVMSFLRARQLAEAQRITLLMTDLSAEVRQRFEPAGLFQGENCVNVFPDLDRALEWCENRLLEGGHLDQTAMLVTLRAQLQCDGLPGPSSDSLMSFLEKVDVGVGEYLTRQGDEPDDLYFVEQGNVSVYLELEGDKRTRLRTLGPGTVVGELGFYLGTKRTASVIADSPATAYRLTRSALARMRESEPELAAAFHEFMVRTLSEKLVDATQTLDMVLR